MFTRLSVEGFKSIRSVDIHLKNPMILIGPNGGGKSNVLDAIRLLQGIGNGLSVAEILDGRGPDAAYRRSDGIRGGAAEVLWRGPGPGEAAETAGVMAHIDTPAGEVGYGVRIDPAPAKKRDIL